MSNEQNFWLDLPKPFFILAPMEDVTDVVFRHVVSEAQNLTYFSRNSQIQKVIVTLQEETVHVVD